jgi:excisionase family DNA binding protein
MTLMDTLMTIDEVASYLRLSKDTVYRMVQKGRIPASKVGMQWRFRRADVDQWLDKNKNVGRIPPPREPAGNS